MSGGCCRGGSVSVSVLPVPDPGVCRGHGLVSGVLVGRRRAGRRGRRRGPAHREWGAEPERGADPLRALRCIAPALFALCAQADVRRALNLRLDERIGALRIFRAGTISIYRRPAMLTGGWTSARFDPSEHSLLPWGRHLPRHTGQRFAGSPRGGHRRARRGNSDSERRRKKGSSP